MLELCMCRLLPAMMTPPLSGDSRERLTIPAEGAPEAF